MKQMWLLTAVAVVAVLAAGHFLAVSPKKGEVEALHEKTVAQQTDNRNLQAEIDRLLAQQKLVPLKQRRLAEIAKNIPRTPMLPALIRSLTKASRDTGTELQTLEPVKPEFAEGTSGGTAPAAAAPAPAAPTAGAGTGVTPVAPAPRPNVGKLAILPIKFTVWCTYAELQEFLIELEGHQRSMMVTGAVIESVPDTDESSYGQPGDLKVVVTARVFMRGSTKAAPAPRPATNASAPAATE